jgi:hypothetical protein
MVKRCGKEDAMTNESLDSIAFQINSLAEGYQIGKLQEIRKELKGLKKRPTKNIFTPITISDKWAFHHGGRREIQFNIGIEDTNNLRYGVAFSLETSKALPNRKFCAISAQIAKK